MLSSMVQEAISRRVGRFIGFIEIWCVVLEGVEVAGPD